MNPEPEMKIKTAAKLTLRKPFWLAEGNFSKRVADANGTVHSVVPGFGGDLWYVLLDGVTLAQIYSTDELLPVTNTVCQ